MLSPANKFTVTRCESCTSAQMRPQPCWYLTGDVPPPPEAGAALGVEVVGATSVPFSSLSDPVVAQPLARSKPASGHSALRAATKSPWFPLPRQSFKPVGPRRVHGAMPAEARGLP